MNKVIQPDNTRERILSYGAHGTGKSKFYVDIYDRTDASMYILDTDIAIERMFAERDQSRLTVKEVFDYETLARATIEFVRKAKTKDWIVVDMSTITWSWAQEYVIMQQSKEGKGKSLKEEELALWVPKASDSTDWVVVNRLYNNWTKRLLQSPANILFLSEEQDIAEGSWEGETDREFREFGMKPRGNKRLPHVVHTVIYHKKIPIARKPTDYRVYMAKERVGRTCDWDTPHKITGKSLVDEYLVRVGGWEIEDGDSRPKRRRRASAG